MKKIALLFAIICVASALNGMQLGGHRARTALSPEQMKLFDNITRDYVQKSYELNSAFVKRLAQESLSLEERLKIRAEWEQQKKVLEQQYDYKYNRAMEFYK